MNNILSHMKLATPTNWQEFFNSIINESWYLRLNEQVINSYNDPRTIVYPEINNLFRAFTLGVNDIKVVILGQDPYHNGSADGLAFSTKPTQPIPASLKNIYKSILIDYPLNQPRLNGDLTYLLNQGVFLINSALTVEKGKPNSHADIGWHKFTEHLIKYINDNTNNVVFLLWGKFAQNFSSLLDSNKHKIIKSVHPSPFSFHLGFIEAHCFLKTNKYLNEHNKDIINW